MPAAEKANAVYLNSFKLYLNEYRLKERRRVLDREVMVYHPHEQVDVPVPSYRVEWTRDPYAREDFVGLSPRLSIV